MFLLIIFIPLSSYILSSLCNPISLSCLSIVVILFTVVILFIYLSYLDNLLQLYLYLFYPADSFLSDFDCFKNKKASERLTFVGSLMEGPPGATAPPCVGF